MPTDAKVQKVKALTQQIQKASAITFFDYKNLGANALNDLRNKAKEAGAEVVIAKNTLVTLALGKQKASEEDLKGQTALLFSYADSISPLKVLAEAAKKFAGLKIKGAFIDGTYYEPAKVVVLSQLPSRLELIGKTLCGFRSPLVKFGYALAAIAAGKEVQE
ncbi:50S ribosomal protein L10 [Patescibacteria group bacterium]|nr:50S ribosomal protein L10 [Patescibacteria group bacterium]MBU1970612.1 50S ribosomal protein L10 [Patescibacteria group bacterium]